MEACDALIRVMRASFNVNFHTNSYEVKSPSVGKQIVRVELCG